MNYKIMVYVLSLSMMVVSFIQSQEPCLTSILVSIKPVVSDTALVSNPYTQSIVQLQQHPALPSSNHHVVRPSADIMAKPQVIDLSKDQSYQSSLGYRVPLDAVMKLYTQLGLDGNLAQLSFEESRLRGELNQFVVPDFLSEKLPIRVQGGRYQLKRRLSFIIKVRQHDVTQIMHTIQGESLVDAKRALQEMHVDVYGRPYPAYGPAPLRPATQTIMPSKFTPAQLREAERAYCSRADYKQAVRRSQAEPQEPQQVSPPSCHTVLHTDLVPTAPTDVSNISSEVDDKIEQALRGRVSADPMTDLDTYMRQVQDVLDDMQQGGELTPTPNRNQEILGIFAKSFTNRLHPVTQFQDCVSAVGKFAWWSLTEGGQYLHITADQIEHAEQTIQELFSTIASIDPRKLTEEQRAHLLGSLVGDVVFFKGFGASIAYLQEIAALSISEQKLASLVEAFDKIVEAAPSEVVRVAMADGKVVEVYRRVSLFQKMGSEVVKDAERALGAAAKESAAGVVSQAEYTFVETAAKHLNEIAIHGKYKGELVRPYMRSPLTIREILATGKGVSDVTARKALNFRVPGRFRGCQGVWELVIDPDKKLIYHFLFKGGAS